MLKRGGVTEPWDSTKLIKAVNKAATRVGEAVDFGKLIPLVQGSNTTEELFHKLMVALPLLGNAKT